MNIGVLALQGAFIEHEKVLDKLGVDYTELRQKSDLDTKLDGIILPGGESTVQGKLLRELDMFENIKEQIEDGLPVLATCAGMILLAKDIEDDDTKHLSTLPITVKRNAYGRQLGSFYTESDYEGLGEIPMTFIRAPYVAEAKPEVDVTAVVNDTYITDAAAFTADDPLRPAVLRFAGLPADVRVQKLELHFTGGDVALGEICSIVRR